MKNRFAFAFSCDAAAAAAVFVGFPCGKAGSGQFCHHHANRISLLFCTWLANSCMSIMVVLTLIHPGQL
jgi:hypothetical protein